MLDSMPNLHDGAGQSGARLLPVCSFQNDLLEGWWHVVWVHG